MTHQGRAVTAYRWEKVPDTWGREVQERSAVASYLHDHDPCEVANIPEATGLSLADVERYVAEFLWTGEAERLADGRIEWDGVAKRPNPSRPP